MCGICGTFAYRSGAPVDEALLRAMTASMTHRGPDEDGFLVDGPVGLGMRRLSIIDLAGGSQPLTSEDGAVSVVMNGEIYNFRELRRELAAHGHVFRTRSDTESVVHAYEQWGVDGLARLNGMFTVAVWDARARRLVVARDPFGVKPLYVRDDGERLSFASEVRALLCDPSVPRTVDVDALGRFLELTYVPAPRTVFEGIEKLLPGHALVAGDGRTELRRFSPGPPPLREWPSEDELVEELAAAISDAVVRQLVADVPVGLMLSGGVDSSAIAALMSEHATGSIETFTVGFAGEFADNELESARETARRVGSAHHEAVISAAEYMDFLPEAITHLEEPVATTSTLALHRLSVLARRDVKVVLTGQGADEAFAGYPRYLGERYGRAYRALPSVVRDRLVRPLVDRVPRNEQLKRAARSLGAADPEERRRRIYQVIGDDLRDALLGGAAPNGDAVSSRAPWAADVRGLPPLEGMLYADARTSLADNLLLYGDKMTMAASLEARVPYLDLELMRLVESIPARHKIRRGRQKHVLKRALERWVPREVIERRKIGFATPVDDWFRGTLRSTVRERLLSEGSACRRYLDAPTVERLVDEHVAGRHDHKRVLFSLLTFELWHQEFIAAGRPSVGRERAQT